MNDKEKVKQIVEKYNKSIAESLKKLQLQNSSL